MCFITATKMESYGKFQRNEKWRNTFFICRGFFKWFTFSMQIEMFFLMFYLIWFSYFLFFDCILCYKSKVKLIFQVQNCVCYMCRLALPKKRFILFNLVKCMYFRAWIGRFGVKWWFFFVLIVWNFTIYTFRRIGSDKITVAFQHEYEFTNNQNTKERDEALSKIFTKKTEEEEKNSLSESWSCRAICVFKVYKTLKITSLIYGK